MAVPGDPAIDRISQGIGDWQQEEQHRAQTTRRLTGPGAAAISNTTAIQNSGRWSTMRRQAA